jgi:hypothetical protein
MRYFYFCAHVVLMNNSGADPHAAIGVYAREVLPKLRAGMGWVERTG